MNNAVRFVTENFSGGSKTIECATEAKALALLNAWTGTGRASVWVGSKCVAQR